MKPKNAPDTSVPEERKPPKKTEENRLRTYFVRLFGKYDIRNEQQFNAFGKRMIFIVLVVMECLILLQHADLVHTFFSDGWKTLVPLCIVTTVLTISEWLKLFALKGGVKEKIVFYVVNALAACCFLFFASGNYALIIYLLVLTEFYITTEKYKLSFVVFFVSMPIYAICFALNVRLRAGLDVDAFALLRASLDAIVALSLHFLIMHVALAFYRQFVRLDKALKELDASKNELEKAYAVVAEVTALEERQRIAKEIHDTAGHSITTVIMQTEAAKLIIEKDPEEAKGKIVAANLQARHALEELRDSVHLLSGRKGNETLKDSLIGIIHESTDGTGITIRSEIENANVSDAKYRFLCNTLKEGISNGLRHGGATAFWFELKAENGRLHFLLSDNGTGVNIGELQQGFGLSTMCERARALGGEVAFESEKDEGFEIRLTLPTDSEE